MITKPKILIFGAAGFIGSHVTEELVKSGYRVQALDILHYPGNLDRIKYLKEKSGVCVASQDLNFPIAINISRYLNQFEIILNFASISHVDFSIDNPVETIQTNTNIITNILELCRKNKPKLLIHLSSDEVLGPAHHSPFLENDRHKPSNPYSASKSFQDQLINSYHVTYGLPYLILRTTNIYGERQNLEKFIPKVIHSIRRGFEIPMYNRDGITGKRTWFYVKNLADCIIKIIEEGYTNRTIHIPGYDEFDNGTIVKKISDIMKMPAKTNYKDYQNARPGEDYSYSINRSAEVLDVEPKFTFEEGLERTIKSYYGEKPLKI